MTAADVAAEVAALSTDKSYSSTYAQSAMALIAKASDLLCPECEEYVPDKSRPCPGCVETCPDQSTCDENCIVVCNELCPEGVCSDDTCAGGVARDRWICEDENCAQLNALVRSHVRYGTEVALTLLDKRCPSRTFPTPRIHSNGSMPTCPLTGNQLPLLIGRHCRRDQRLYGLLIHRSV